MPLLLALFGVMALLTLPVLLQAAQGDSRNNGIEVITSSLVFDPQGRAHVFGEVTNDGGRSVDNVFIVAVFHDEDYRTVASSYAFIQMDALRPGEKSAFEMVLEGTESAEIYDYDLFANSRIAGPKTACLSLNVMESFSDDAGRYHLAGMVVNNGNLLTDSVRVSATFYNGTGHVIAIDAMDVVNEDGKEILHPNANATFDLTGIPYDAYNANSKISSYSISVESPQYSIINDSITKDNIACPIEPSTSLTVHIDNMGFQSLTQDVIVSGKVAVLIESEKYVKLEVYDQSGKLYHRQLCEPDNDGSYLCTVTFYPLNEHTFILKAKYREAFAQLTFTNP
jgi:hypothetical protein